MESQAAKTIARRALEGVWTAGGGVPAEDVYTSDVVSHQRSHPTVDDVHGINVLKSFVAQFHAGFPDFVDTVELQLAEGDLVTTQFTSAGTHSGEFLGIVPTGQRVEWMGIEIARITEGKIVENWVAWDMYGMLRQLGTLPEMG